MTIRTNLNHLRPAQANLNATIRDYPTWHRWLESLLPDGYPAGADYNAKTQGGTADPTGSTAIQRSTNDNLLTHAANLTQRINELTLELYRLTQTGPARIDTTAIVRAARCSGAIDPTCTRLADGRRHKTGLCDACWQQQYRDQRQAS